MLNKIFLTKLTNDDFHFYIAYSFIVSTLHRSWRSQPGLGGGSCLFPFAGRGGEVPFKYKEYYIRHLKQSLSSFFFLFWLNFIPWLALTQLWTNAPRIPSTAFDLHWRFYTKIILYYIPYSSQEFLTIFVAYRWFGNVISMLSSRPGSGQ